MSCSSSYIFLSTRKALALVCGILLAAGLFFLFAPQTRAANGINQQINYQARLLDLGGSAVADDDYDVKLSIYDSAVGGTRLWTATGTVGIPTALTVTTVDGLFTISLGDTSTDGGSQNALDASINWDSDALYLGITVGVDAEMTPRRRLTAVPQAFNAMQLQGMSASGTTYGGDDRFTIHQATNNAATDTRSALTIRSGGTSDTNDFLLRGVNDLGATVLSINRQGNVTSSGILAMTGSGTSTFTGGVSTTGMLSGGFFRVLGNTTLGDDVDADTISFNGRMTTNLVPENASTRSVGTEIAPWAAGYFVNASMTNATATTLSVVNVSSTSVTTTNLFATNLSIGGTFSSAGMAWTNATGTNTTSTNMAVVDRLDNVLTTNSTWQVSASIITPTPYFLAAQGRYLYGVDRDTHFFRVYDTTDPEIMTLVGSVAVSDNPGAIAIAGKYAYVGSFLLGILSVIDISAPSSPTVVATLNLGNTISGVTVVGSYAYVANYNGQYVDIVDISNPESPTLTGRISAPGQPWSVAVQGKYLYFSEVVGGTIKKYDISNPSAPVSAGTYTFANPIQPTQIHIQGRYLYAAGFGNAVLAILDISGTGNPSLVSTVALPDAFHENSLGVQGRYVYAGLQNGNIYAIDVQDPENGSVVASIAFPGGGMIQGMVASGKYLFAGSYTGSRIAMIDIGGIQTSGITAASGEFGNMYVQSDGSIQGSLQVGRGVTVGMNGIHSDGMITATVSSTSSTVRFINSGSNTYGTTWGAFINRLAVGNNVNVTGTNDFMQVISHNSNSQNGLCLDDTKTAMTCVYDAGSSLQADGAINAGAFDLAERYQMSGFATSSDVLVFDTNATNTMKLSPGVPYDPHLAGVYSTRPGFLLGFGDGAPVALAGRVPTKVSTMNGPIAVGDLLTTSPFPGVAMKATKPGMTLGYALEPASVTSTIEVFIKTGYSALGLLNTDGTIAQLTDDLVVAPTAIASLAQPTADSWGLTFRGSAWNGAEAITSDFRLVNDVTSVTSSAFTILNASNTTLFALDQSGTLRLGGDLVMSGKIYPVARSGPQTSSYIFLETEEHSTSTYIATNADGWQASDSYDFAERYYSPDKLEPGDLVVASQNGRIHVQRAWTEHQLLVGIVSTRPGFVAGKPASSTYPIALAGRVPTKISTIKGAIRAGDPLAASTIPGVAVKATEAGPIVGQALEDYDGTAIGFIEVYVNPSWWGGEKKEEVEVIAPPTIIATPVGPQLYRGLALMLSGAKKVHVAFPSLGGYPNIQVTPYAEIEGGWWITSVTDQGFDVIFKQEQTRDVGLSWTVSGFSSGERVYQSDGTFAEVDPTTGVIVSETRATSTEVIIEPVAPPTPPPAVVTPAPSVSTETPTATTTELIPESAPTTTEMGEVSPLPEEPPEEESIVTTPVIEEEPTPPSPVEEPLSDPEQV